MVRPRVEATLENAVYVAELAGTLMVRVVPDLRVTKSLQIETTDEPILRVKSVRFSQYLKHLSIHRIATLLINKFCGTDVREWHSAKHELISVINTLLSNSPVGMDVILQL